MNEIYGNDLYKVNILPSMKKERFDSEAVCLEDELYVFSGLDNNVGLITSVEKYSPSTKTCNKVADRYDNRRYFCGCAFIEKIFIIGGCYYGDGEWPTVINTV